MPSAPDFIGVGALGSGTGWWHGLLLAHPAIRPPQGGRRALHHFDHFCATEMTDADHVHDGFQQQRGTTQAAKKTPLWDDLMDALRATLEPEVSRLAELAPEVDVALWPNFAHLAADAVRA